MSIRKPLQNFMAFSLLLFPLTVPLGAQEPPPPVPPPVPPTVTTLPVTIATPVLPAGLLLAPCPTQPQATATGGGAAPPPGEAMTTAHVPMSGGWCSQVLTDDEMHIIRSVLDFGQDDRPASGTSPTTR